MYKTLYQTESNMSDIKTLSKDILKSARYKDFNNYTAIRLFMLNGREILISRTKINVYSVIIRNKLGLKIDEFEFNNIEATTFDFINYKDKQ